MILGLTAVAPAAQARPDRGGPGNDAGYKRVNSVCVNDGSSITIGGKVKILEKGLSGINRFRMKWLLYTVDPRSPGIHVAERRKTMKSNYFADAGSMQWTRNHQWTTDLNPRWLVVKLTWERPGKRDYDHKLPVAYCQ